ncbi:phage assembly protein [Pseudomonas laurentiana]|uniref:Phage baseplate assembly protein n=1 Tax=Pseudomonas laurentiana TaxID=2364649 RepID=A0A6I5RSQ9_9PSED|nr:phage baseplate assembly protein V [Pseudomonas laurentiana]NES10785.1 phage baseplate assembly protein [Pseudomonas laurentiana]GGU53988.1 phage assembly protein [Pseudomonas laurentiana]
MSGLKQILARGVVTLVKATSKLQSLQMTLLAGEVKSGMEHFEPYGFTSNAHPGAEGIALFVGGDRSHGVVVCVADRKFRLQGLKSGEVALYTDEGDRLHFKRGRVIEVETLTLKVKADDAVEFDTPVIRTTGRIESAGDQVAGGVSQMQHVHEGSDKKPVAGG